MDKHISKIVVASDSFKGSLSSLAVAEAVSKGIQTVYPAVEVVKTMVADGGEGTLDAIVNGCGGQKVSIRVEDPVGRLIESAYGILNEQTAIIELSAASGLPLLTESERNPLYTSTYGTGELIADALRRGCRKIYVGIGGSATNDGGMGLLAALGVKFYDASGRLLKPCGAELGRVARIDTTALLPEAKEAEFIVACDVDNPFYGERGAAYVFAPQKGATREEVVYLDNGLRHYARMVHNVTGIAIDDTPGAGAAGGVGGAFLAFLHARLVPGIEMVLDAIRFDDLIAGASLVITGEGKLDRQTTMGKAPAGVLRRATAQGIPTIAIGGSVENCPELDALGFKMIVGVTPEGMPLTEAMNPAVASTNITTTVIHLLRQGIYL